VVRRRRADLRRRPLHAAARESNPRPRSRAGRPRTRGGRPPHARRVESTFPLDTTSVSYRTLWNCYKLLAAKWSLTVSEKVDIFGNTARRVYSLGKPADDGARWFEKAGVATTGSKKSK
jgi:hypothetical protein